MTLKYLFGLLFVFGVCSCSYDPTEEQTREEYSGSYSGSKKGTGVSIENGPRQGFQYFDTIGTEYSYRYITTTISNDSLVPVHIIISFSKEYSYLRSTNSLKSKVFLLPRELTPERQQFDKSMSKELREFLDTEVDVPISLDKIIHPNERLVMTFGVLTDMKYGDFMRMELISSDKRFHFNSHDSFINLVNSPEDPFTMYLGLNLVNSFIIPCGQISFSKL